LPRKVRLAVSIAPALPHMRRHRGPRALLRYLQDGDVPTERRLSCRASFSRAQRAMRLYPPHFYLILKCRLSLDQ
ncbi:hypothetical protein PENTCL1PPCAC_4779, partial [Pristionchus entomophagus]